MWDKIRYKLCVVSVHWIKKIYNMDKEYTRVKQEERGSMWITFFFRVKNRLYALKQSLEHLFLRPNIDIVLI